MKKEVCKILTEKNKQHLFTDERFELIKEVMRHGMKKDDWLKNYLSLDPLNKAAWCADQLIFLTEAGHI